MALPVIERIALEIAKRLDHSLIPNIKVVRPDREGKNFTKSDGSILIQQQESTENEELSHEGNPPAVAFDCKFEIFCFVRDVPAGDTYVAACNRYASQIIYALTHPEVDSDRWYTFSENAIISRFTGQGPFVDNDVTAGVMVSLQTTYRVSENDHTQVRA